MEGLLSIGSVVSLKTSQVPVMIIGYLPASDNEIYQYMGVIYPIGYHPEGTSVLFDEEEIKEVLFTGHEDENSEKFKHALEDVMFGDYKSPGSEKLTEDREVFF